MRTLTNIIIISSLLSFCACATTARFESTPTEEGDFLKDRTYLTSNYSDIDKYDRYFAGPDEAPTVEDLIVLWGPPHSTEKRWAAYAFNMAVFISISVMEPAFAVVILLDPYPQEKYVWNKGDYQITAYGRKEALTKFERRIHNWKWATLKDTED